MPFYYKLRPNSSGITEEVRLRTVKKLKQLRTALDGHFGADGCEDDDGTIKIGTWNIRDFGTKKSGGRDTECLYYIAEIISRVDILAMQEVKADLKQFKELMKILGPDWDYIATDVTGGGAGNSERMAFLYNRKKANFRNIAGELTLPAGKKVLASFGERLLLQNGCMLELPPGTDLSGDYRARTEKQKNGEIKLDDDVEIPLPAGSKIALPANCAFSVKRRTVIERPPGTKGVARISIPTGTISSEDFGVRLPSGVLDDSFKQFARTPFLVSFQAGWLKINLCTVHIYFGDNEDPELLAQRKREIASLSEALSKRAEKEMKDDPNGTSMLGVLGDFNIISKEHETMQALESNGFVVPTEIKEIPGSNVDKSKAYDQIAFWKPQTNRRYAKIDVQRGNVFDFFKHVYTLDERSVYRPGASEGSYKTWRTYKMSDHLFMWVELKSDFSNEYLDMCEKESEH